MSEELKTSDVKAGAELLHIPFGTPIIIILNGMRLNGLATFEQVKKYAEDRGYKL